MGTEAEADRRKPLTRIVCDTGPVLHLSESQNLKLLELVGEIHIPPDVDQEMRIHQENWAASKPDWIQVTPLLSPYEGEAWTWQQAGLVDAGESAAIALARQLSAEWLLTDDALARILAQSLGIEVHGSLGLVLWAAAKGQLGRSEAEATLNRLANSSLWISRRVLAEAQASLDQLFS